MINFKWRPKRTQKDQEGGECKIEMDPDMFSAGTWLLREGFYEKNCCRFLMYYLYAITVFVVQILIAIETMNEFFMDNTDIYRAMKQIENGNIQNLEDFNFGTQDIAQQAQEFYQNREHKEYHTILKNAIGISLLSFFFRQINKSACITYELLSDKKMSCGYKVCWLILFILKITGEYQAFQIMMSVLSQPNSSIFVVLSNSVGVIVLIELPNYASSFYFMYLESYHNSIVNQENFLIMNVDTSIIMSTVLVSFMMLISQIILLFVIILFEPLKKLENLATSNILEINKPYLKTQPIIVTILDYGTLLLFFFMPLWIMIVKCIRSKCRCSQDIPDPPKSPIPLDRPTSPQYQQQIQSNPISQSDNNSIQLSKFKNQVPGQVMSQSENIDFYNNN